MTPITFPGVTSVLGAPPGWDEAKNGPCVDMPVMRRDGAFTSCWRLSFRERLALLFRPRAVIVLTMAAMRHPPVALEVQRVRKAPAQRSP